MATAAAPPIARRRIRAAVRATPDVGEGTFEAIVSSYAETYEIGWGWRERIMAGCFADSIADHPTIPVCWNHDWKAGPIGHGAAQELDLGLIVRGELYLDLDPLVQRVWRSMMAKAVEEWSIAFFPERIVEDEAEPYTDLIERGDLIEATACFRGANPGTETLDLRGAPIVSVDGDAQVEVVRLRKLFAVPELRIGDTYSSGMVSATGTAGFLVTGQPVAASTTKRAPATTSGGGARRSAGDPAGAAPLSGERLVRARARLAKLRAEDAEPDEPVDLAEALDAVIDEILDALDEGDLDEAEALATAAESTSDDLLDVLGGTDSDEGEPAEKAGEVVAASTLAGRLLSSRAGFDFIWAALRSASESSPSTTKSTTPV